MISTFASPRSLPLARLLDAAADAVAEVIAGRSLNAALARCPPDARPGTQSIAFAVLRRLGTARVVRSALVAKTPPPRVDALLLTALALLAEPTEPMYAPHTLVDQAVGAARARAGAKASAPFVNAVLRRFLREHDVLLADALRDPVARYNHPRWWIDRLARDWPDDWTRILEAGHQAPPMTLRVNRRRTSRSAYAERLEADGMASTPVGDDGLNLQRPCPVTALPGFEDGWVSVQDAAAQRAAPLLIGDRLRDGARVLDACAAPGGKTAHLLERADLDLLAIDRDAERLAKVDATLARLGLAARTQVGDAAEPAAWWDGRAFDAILLDAPCSASGIVRRHPDVRWLRRQSDVERLAVEQRRLLVGLWPLLARQGRLLFCTCSVFKAEGSQTIDAFLQRQTDARIAAVPPSPGHLLPLGDNRGQQAPVSDGFFYALLEKT